MTITVTSTSKIVWLNGMPARVWEGKTESGISIHCYITRIAVEKNQPPEVDALFEKELLECKAPSPDVEKIPLKLIL